jgi:hypothetical protein
MVLRRPRSLIGLSMSKHGGGRLWLSDARESGAPASSGAPAAAWASAQRRIIASLALTSSAPASPRGSRSRCRRAPAAPGLIQLHTLCFEVSRYLP